MAEEKKIIVSQVARPVRQRKLVTSFAEIFMPYFPDLKKKLTEADSPMTALSFVEKAVASTAFVSLTLLVLTFLFVFQLKLPLWYLLPLLLLYPLVIFRYFMLYPDVAVIKRQKDIDYEIVFAGRHLVIALRSGMPLFDALVGVSQGYGEVSREFNRIVEKITLGVPVSQAIREIAQNNPSKNFTRLLLQVSNSLASGANVADALDAVLDQISREQMTELKAYGQKLTPMIMFFMIFGIILPSLGVAFLVILLSLISSGKFAFSSSILLFAFAFIAIVQFLFLALIESSRPKYTV
jgi:flagellar protein FlaJ